MDARAKIVLTGVYSICLFFIDTALGLGLAALMLGAEIVLGRVRPALVFRSLGIVYLIAALTILFNALTPPAALGLPENAGTVWSAGVFQVGWSLAGLWRGVFFAARLLLIVWASLMLAATTPVTELADALRWFLKPLAALGAPVDDIAMILQIAIRFIPLTIAEIDRVKNAQIVRGAALGVGSPLARMKAWGRVFVPVFAGLFRQADRLALAMDARCYGAASHRTHLPRAQTSPDATALAVLGCAVSILLAIFL